MSQEVPGFAQITHEIYSVRDRTDAKPAFRPVALLLRNDLGHHFDIVFDDDVIPSDIMIACPVGTTADELIVRLRTLIG